MPGVGFGVVGWEREQVGEEMRGARRGESTENRDKDTMEERGARRGEKIRWRREQRGSDVLRGVSGSAHR